MEFVIGDRATDDVGGRKLPVEETVRQAVASWLGEHLPRVQPGRDFVTRVVLAPGSAELRSILRGARTRSRPTSRPGPGYAPLGPTEDIVLGVEHFLNGPAFKRDSPTRGRT